MTPAPQSSLTPGQSKLIEDYNLANLSDRELLLISVAAINSLGERHEGLRNEAADQRTFLDQIKTTIDGMKLKMYLFGVVVVVITSTIPEAQKVVKPFVSSLFGGL